MESLPNDILDIIKDFIIFKPKTRNELQKAVDLWCINKNKTLQKYGHISIWDTSLITDMCGLFYDEPDSPYWEYSVTTFNNRNDNNSHTDSEIIVIMIVIVIIIVTMIVIVIKSVLITKKILMII